MTTDLSQGAVYTDFQGLAKLKSAARANSPAAVAKTAKQFEALFIQMMLKAMDKATPHDGILDSQQGDFYRGMFDQQLATTLANGRGLGIADMLMRQLGGSQTNTQTGPLPAPGVKPSAGHLQSSITKAPAPETTATAAAANQHGRDWPPQSRQEFVRALRPYARRAARALGVAPRALVAQAALETGWGQHMPRQPGGRSSFNLFAVKADGGWQGTTVNASTREYQHNKASEQRATFRAYDSIAASFRDYVSLLQSSPRYRAALNTGEDVSAFASALQRAGYASDPAYAEKLQATAKSAALIHTGPAFKSL